MRTQPHRRRTERWSIWKVAPLLMLSLQLTSARAYDWEIEVYDSNANAYDGVSSLALDSASLPHIGYSYESEHDLRYAYRSGFGHAGWHIETVDSAGMVGEFPSLALGFLGACSHQLLQRVAGRSEVRLS